jgi:hypothetical protein
LVFLFFLGQFFLFLGCFFLRGLVLCGLFFGCSFLRCFVFGLFFLLIKCLALTFGGFLLFLVFFL